MIIDELREVRAGRRAGVSLRRQLVARAGRLPEGPGIFTATTRHVGYAWVALTVPLVALAGLFIHGERPYLIAWAVVSGLYTTPALVGLLFVCRRVTHGDRPFWVSWTCAVAALYSVGVALLVSAITGVTFIRWIAMAFVGIAVLVFSVALVELLNARSGDRALLLDVLESTMLATAIVAFAPLLLAGRSVDDDTMWFTVPALVSAVALVFGFCWSLALYRSLIGERRTVEGFGVALALTCAVDGFAHVAHGMTGFALPASAMLALHALAMGLLLLLPSHVAKEVTVGLRRLAPEAQVRTSSLDTVAIALLVPLVVVTFLVRDRIDWANWYFVGVALALLILATVRGKLGLRETRRLYGRVEEAAEERRVLLADVMQSVDHDRHRVAAQLHQQATSFYVTFTTYLRSSTRDGDPVHPALLGVREDLARQAEAMRQLMLSVRPIESERGGGDLSTTIEAYIDSLYGDGLAPRVAIDVDDELDLDWTTETIVFRILQEALRNVHEHARARRVSVTIGYDDEAEGVVVTVADDGDGFDANELLFESGIATMRNFAAHADGSLEIEAVPSEGTTVRAVIRSGFAVDHGVPADMTAPARLRLIDGGRGEGGPAEGPDADVIDLRTAPAAPPDIVTDVSAALGRLLEAAPRQAIADARARRDGRRGFSAGSGFFHFTFAAEHQVVSATLRVVFAAFISVPVLEAAALVLGSRPDSLRWVLLAMVLLGVELATNVRDVRAYRARQWDRFDPRVVFAQLTLATLACGALGVAVGGHAALFTPSLVMVLLIASIVTSRPMVATLWAINVAVVGAVLVFTQDLAAPVVWTLGVFAVTTALMASILDLIIATIRDGLTTLENVADFASFSSGVRQWADGEPGLVERLSSVTRIDHLALFERVRGDDDLRELARWSPEGRDTTFPADALRAIAARATTADGIQVDPVAGHKLVRIALAAETTGGEVILAVELPPGGAALDAALVTAVNMVASVRERSGLIDDLIGEARTDPLTGLANRRHLQEFLFHEMSRASRTGTPLSFAILDLDHFKAFNDTWGHAAGDRVLAGFAARLLSRVRAQDVVARYGGEEFCVLFPSTALGDAEGVLDELHRVTAANEHEVTFSAGIAQWVPGEPVDELIARADAALYRAKAGGRDQTQLADDRSPSTIIR